MSTVLDPAKRVYTAEDLERLSAQGCRYELIRGELFEMSPPGSLHGSTTDRLAAYVRIHVDEFDLGECFAAETGFLIERNPDTVAAPDYAFIAKDRLPDPIPDTYAPVIPDLVIETRSPNDTKKEVAAKVERWLQAGVRVVWESDPKARKLTVHRPGIEPRILGIEDELTGDEVLPGFRYPLRRLFRK